MSPHSALEENLERVRARVASAARAAGRDPAEVELVAVTKSVDAVTAAELCRLGQHDLGENRADELDRKQAYFREHGLVARWHFVGHVQKNKARRIVALADVIHSIDSPALLERVEEIAAELGKKLHVFVQVKLTTEDRKTGLDPTLLAEIAEQARALRQVKVLGLMAMAPLRDPHEAGPVFTECARLARELARSPRQAQAFAEGRVRLSMGMSDDFETAIAAGSDCVRIGTLLFEGRAT